MYTLEDITERKSMEEMLTRVTAGSSIPSFAINKQHKVTYWNTAIEAFTGIKKEEIIGTDEQWKVFYTEKRLVMADLIVDGVSADEIEAYSRGKFKNSDLIDGAYEAEDFFPALGSNGKWLHFTASHVRGNDGETIGAVETLEDITERKSMEEMLTRIIDGYSIPSFVINKQHKVTYWNTAIEALTGIKKEEIIGTDGQWRPFYTEKRPAMADLIVDGASADEIEAYYRGKFKKSDLIDGAYEAEDFYPALGRIGKWLHFTASPIRGDDGETIGAIETLGDITEQKNAEHNLRYYLKEITRAQEEERKRIARELHDDTAQNLIALLHKLENLLNDRTNLPVSEARVLWGLHEQIREILQEVRHFSRDLRPSILDDLGLLPAVEWLVKELKNEYWVEASLKIVGNERRLAEEVELLLFRIVQEALRNIEKHAQASKAEVKVEFDKNKIMVTISDTGVGFQVPESFRDLPYAGKLGLAGMQERVELINGSLKMKSELGKGTTVFIEVPI